MHPKNRRIEQDEVNLRRKLEQTVPASARSQRRKELPEIECSSKAKYTGIFQLNPDGRRLARQRCLRINRRHSAAPAKPSTRGPAEHGQGVRAERSLKKIQWRNRRGGVGTCEGLCAGPVFTSHQLGNHICGAAGRTLRVSPVLARTVLGKTARAS
jgi:hypothetical protein